MCDNVTYYYRAMNYIAKHGCLSVCLTYTIRVRLSVCDVGGQDHIAQHLRSS